MGNLVKDPDVRYTNSENAMAVARYTLAVDRRGREGSTDYISCIAFGRGAEFAEKWLKKGMRITVRGRIQTGSYEGRDGKKVYTTDVVVEDHEFAEKKTQNNEYQPNGYRQNNAPQTYASRQSVGDGFMQIPDDVNDGGLPFN